jgi:hypothetical protein
MESVHGSKLIAGRWSEAKQLHAARRAVKEEGEDERVQYARILLGRKQRTHEHERSLVFHQQARYLDFVIYEHARPVVGRGGEIQCNVSRLQVSVSFRQRVADASTEVRGLCEAFALCMLRHRMPSGVLFARSCLMASHVCSHGSAPTR